MNIEATDLLYCIHTYYSFPGAVDHLFTVYDVNTTSTVQYDVYRYYTSTLNVQLTYEYTMIQVISLLL